MSRITVTASGHGECQVVHHESGARLTTSKSVLFGGLGSSFSSTDLLAAALGSCIATDLEPVAERHGLPLTAIRIDVEKEMTASPKRITAFRVTVHLPHDVDDVLLLKLERAASHCLVQRSLSPDIGTGIVFRREAVAAPDSVGA